MAPHNTTGEEFLGRIDGQACYRCKLRGDGLLDPNSNWRLWNADTEVYRAATPESLDAEVFASKEEKALVRMDRHTKAVMWFSVSEALREQHLADMGGRDKTAEQVYHRLWERVAPPGTPCEPLPKIELTDEMRAHINRHEETNPGTKKSRKTTRKK